MHVPLDCANRQIAVEVEHSLALDFACHSPGIEIPICFRPTPDTHANHVSVSVAATGARFRVNNSFEQCPFETAEVDFILLLVDSFLNLQDVILRSFYPPLFGRG